MKKMLGSNLAVVVGIVSLCASAAWGAPVQLDGNVDSHDAYSIHVEDPNEGIFGGDSFDVDAMDFDESGGWLYVGVDTIGPFDRNGAGGASPPQTELWLEFRDAATGLMLFKLTLTDGGETMKLDDVALDGSLWDAEVADDLEFRVDQSLLAGLVSPYDFKARLDNAALPSDDIVTGQVPEPATLALLTLGGVAGLLRRRRT